MDSVEWRKSTYSGNGGADCIELGVLPNGMIGLRDSKDPSGPVLQFRRSELRAFVLGASDGEFNDLI